MLTFCEFFGASLVLSTNFLNISFFCAIKMSTFTLKLSTLIQYTWHTGQFHAGNNNDNNNENVDFLAFNSIRIVAYSMKFIGLTNLKRSIHIEWFCCHIYYILQAASLTYISILGNNKKKEFRIWKYWWWKLLKLQNTNEF